MGLVLNRYVPNVSPLMTHLEFVGNAIFIPYFLIGVGMMVNVKLLFGGIGTLQVAAVMIAVALASKWVASLATQKIFGMRAIEREMIYGLSNAQAGATLAAVLVGYNLLLPDGQRVLNDDVLNGTIILILVTCVFSSFTTERAAKSMVLETRSTTPQEDGGDDEKIMVPLRDPSTAETLITMAVMMRNTKLNRGLVALNVVYDDNNRLAHQEQGRRLMERITKRCSLLRRAGADAGAHSHEHNQRHKARLQGVQRLRDNTRHVSRQGAFVEVPWRAGAEPLWGSEPADSACEVPTAP